MRLTILGSAAAEGLPALFCDCQVCRRARELRGRDLRRRSMYLLDQDVLVDAGPDLQWAAVELGVDLGRLRHLLVTHSHQDHFLAEELVFRGPGFATLPEGAWLTVHGNQQVETRLQQALGADFAACAVDFAQARVGQDVDLGHGRVARPLRANHASGEECLLYLLRSGKATALIANDSGWWPEETWAALAGERLDVVFLDCTSGLQECRDYHMGISTVLETRAELLRRGMIGEETRLVANHFSHNGGLLHEELVARLAPEGLEAGYDGMVVEA